MSFSRISLRISLWYAAAFAAGSVALFVLVGYFLSASLQNKDRELLEAKFQQYATLLENDGLAGLRTRVSARKIPDASRFLVRVSDESGKTVFFHLPEDQEPEEALIGLQQIERRLQEQTRSEKWVSIPVHKDGDNLEVLSQDHPSGYRLQIGKSTEDREEILERLMHIFLWVLLPLTILASLIGAFLSNRLLSPIRWLTQTVKSIRAGNMKARVPLRGRGDELDQLGHLFNEMLTQNERLIQGMKDTLDHVAHDLRTPIMRLQVGTESALQNGNSIEAYREALLDCRENSEVILKILDTVMDISEAEAGALSLKSEKVCLAALVGAVVDLYGFVAEDKGQALEVSCENEISVIGDRTRLLQALANLVDNAIKYSPNGTTIKIRAGQRGSYAYLEVEDEGPGVPEHETQRIWAKLYRGDQSRSTRGLGLGLSLVQAIARAHGGDAESRPATRSGSVFQIRLPLHSENGAALKDKLDNAIL